MSEFQAFIAMAQTGTQKGIDAMVAGARLVTADNVRGVVNNRANVKVSEFQAWIALAQTGTREGINAIVAGARLVTVDNVRDVVENKADIKVSEFQAWIALAQTGTREGINAIVAGAKLVTADDVKVMINNRARVKISEFQAWIALAQTGTQKGINDMVKGAGLVTRRQVHIVVNNRAEVEVGEFQAFIALAQTGTITGIKNIVSGALLTTADDVKAVVDNKAGLKVSEFQAWIALAQTGSLSGIANTVKGAGLVTADDIKAVVENRAKVEASEFQAWIALAQTGTQDGIDDIVAGAKLVTAENIKAVVENEAKVEVSEFQAWIALAQTGTQDGINALVKGAGTVQNADIMNLKTLAAAKGMETGDFQAFIMLAGMGSRGGIDSFLKRFGSVNRSHINEMTNTAALFGETLSEWGAATAITSNNKLFDANNRLNVGAFRQMVRRLDNLATKNMGSVKLYGTVGKLFGEKMTTFQFALEMTKMDKMFDGANRLKSKDFSSMVQELTNIAGQIVIIPGETMKGVLYPEGLSATEWFASGASKLNLELTPFQSAHAIRKACKFNRDNRLDMKAFMSVVSQMSTLSKNGIALGSIYLPIAGTELSKQDMKLFNALGITPAGHVFKYEGVKDTFTVSAGLIDDADLMDKIEKNGGVLTREMLIKWGGELGGKESQSMDAVMEGVRLGREDTMLIAMPVNRSMVSGDVKHVFTPLGLTANETMVIMGKDGSMRAGKTEVTLGNRTYVFMNGNIQHTKSDTSAGMAVTGMEILEYTDAAGNIVMYRDHEGATLKTLSVVAATGAWNVTRGYHKVGEPVKMTYTEKFIATMEAVSDWGARVKPGDRLSYAGRAIATVGSQTMLSFGTLLLGFASAVPVIGKRLDNAAARQYVYGQIIEGYDLAGTTGKFLVGASVVTAIAAITALTFMTGTTGSFFAGIAGMEASSFGRQFSAAVGGTLGMALGVLSTAAYYGNFVGTLVGGTGGTRNMIQFGAKMFTGAAWKAFGTKLLTRITNIGPAIRGIGTSIKAAGTRLNYGFGLARGAIRTGRIFRVKNSGYAFMRGFKGVGRMSQSASPAVKIANTTGRVLRAIGRGFKGAGKGISTGWTRVIKADIIPTTGAARRFIGILPQTVKSGRALAVVNSAAQMGRSWMLIDSAVYTAGCVFQAATTSKSFTDVFKAEILVRKAVQGAGKGALFGGLMRAIGILSVAGKAAGLGKGLKAYVKATKGVGAAIIKTTMITGMAATANVLFDMARGKIRSRGDILRSVGAGALYGLLISYFVSGRGFEHLTKISRRLQNIGAYSKKAGAFTRVTGSELAAWSVKGAIGWIPVAPMFMITRSFWAGLGPKTAMFRTKDPFSGREIKLFSGKGLRALGFSAIQAPLTGRVIKPLLGMFAFEGPVNIRAMITRTQTLKAGILTRAANRVMGSFEMAALVTGADAALGAISAVDSQGRMIHDTGLSKMGRTFFSWAVLFIKPASLSVVGQVRKFIVRTAAKAQGKMLNAKVDECIKSDEAIGDKVSAARKAGGNVAVQVEKRILLDRAAAELGLDPRTQKGAAAMAEAGNKYSDTSALYHSAGVNYDAAHKEAQAKKISVQQAYQKLAGRARRGTLDMASGKEYLGVRNKLRNRMQASEKYAGRKVASLKVTEIAELLTGQKLASVSRADRLTARRVSHGIKALARSGAVARQLIRATHSSVRDVGAKRNITMSWEQTKAVALNLYVAAASSGALAEGAVNPGLIAFQCAGGKTLSIWTSQLAFLRFAKARGMDVSSMKLMVVTDKDENVREGLGDKDVQAVKGLIASEFGLGVHAVRDTHDIKKLGGSGGIYFMSAKGLMNIYYNKEGRQMLKGFNMVTVDEFEAVVQSTSLTYGAVDKGAFARLSTSGQDTFKAFNKVLSSAGQAIRGKYFEQVQGRNRGVDGKHFEVDGNNQMRVSKTFFDTLVNTAISSNRSLVSKLGGEKAVRNLLTEYINRGTNVLTANIGAGGVEFVGPKSGYKGYNIVAANGEILKNTKFSDPLMSLAASHKAQGDGYQVTSDVAYRDFKSATPTGVNIFQALNFVNTNNAFAEKTGATHVMTGYGGTIEGCQQIASSLGMSVMDLGVTNDTIIGQSRFVDGGGMEYTLKDVYTRLKGEDAKVIKAVACLDAATVRRFQGTLKGMTGIDKGGFVFYDKPSDYKSAFNSAVKGGQSAMKAFGDKFHIIGELTTGSNVFGMKDGSIKGSGFFGEVAFNTYGLTTSSFENQRAARVGVNIGGQFRRAPVFGSTYDASGKEITNGRVHYVDVSELRFSSGEMKAIRGLMGPDVADNIGRLSGRLGPAGNTRLANRVWKNAQAHNAAIDGRQLTFIQQVKVENAGDFAGFAAAPVISMDNVQAWENNWAGMDKNAKFEAFQDGSALQNLDYTEQAMIMNSFDADALQNIENISSFSEFNEALDNTMANIDNITSAAGWQSFSGIGKLTSLSENISNIDVSDNVGKMQERMVLSAFNDSISMDGLNKLVNTARVAGGELEIDRMMAQDKEFEGPQLAFVRQKLVPIMQTLADRETGHALRVSEVKKVSRMAALISVGTGSGAAVLGTAAVIGASAATFGLAAAVMGVAGVTFTAARKLARLAGKLERVVEKEDIVALTTGQRADNFNELGRDVKVAVCLHESLSKGIAHGIASMGMMALASKHITNLVARATLGGETFNAVKESVDLLHDSSTLSGEDIVNKVADLSNKVRTGKIASSAAPTIMRNCVEALDNMKDMAGSMSGADSLTGVAADRSDVAAADTTIPSLIIAAKALSSAADNISRTTGVHTDAEVRADARSCVNNASVALENVIGNMAELRSEGRRVSAKTVAVAVDSLSNIVSAMQNMDIKARDVSVNLASVATELLKQIGAAVTTDNFNDKITAFNSVMDVMDRTAPLLTETGTQQVVENAIGSLRELAENGRGILVGLAPRTDLSGVKAMAQGVLGIDGVSDAISFMDAVTRITETGARMNTATAEIPQGTIGTRLFGNNVVETSLTNHATGVTANVLGDNTQAIGGFMNRTGDALTQRDVVVDNIGSFNQVVTAMKTEANNTGVQLSAVRADSLQAAMETRLAGNNVTETSIKNNATGIIATVKGDNIRAAGAVMPAVDAMAARGAVVDGPEAFHQVVSTMQTDANNVGTQLSHVRAQTPQGAMEARLAGNNVIETGVTHDATGLSAKVLGDNMQVAGAVIMNVADPLAAKAERIDTAGKFAEVVSSIQGNANASGVQVSSIRAELPGAGMESRFIGNNVAETSIRNNATGVTATVLGDNIPVAGAVMAAADAMAAKGAVVDSVGTFSQLVSDMRTDANNAGAQLSNVKVETPRIAMEARFAGNNVIGTSITNNATGITAHIMGDNIPAAGVVMGAADAMAAKGAVVDNVGSFSQAVSYMMADADNAGVQMSNVRVETPQSAFETRLAGNNVFETSINDKATGVTATVLGDNVRAAGAVMNAVEPMIAKAAAVDNVNAFSQVVSSMQANAGNAGVQLRQVRSETPRAIMQSGLADNNVINTSITDKATGVTVAMLGNNIQAAGTVTADTLNELAAREVPINNIQSFNNHLLPVVTAAAQNNGMQLSSVRTEIPQNMTMAAKFANNRITDMGMTHQPSAVSMNMQTPQGRLDMNTADAALKAMAGAGMVNNAQDVMSIMNNIRSDAGAGAVDTINNIRGVTPQRVEITVNNVDNTVDITQQATGLSANIRIVEGTIDPDTEMGAARAVTETGIMNTARDVINAIDNIGAELGARMDKVNSVSGMTPQGVRLKANLIDNIVTSVDVSNEDISRRIQAREDGTIDAKRIDNTMDRLVKAAGARPAVLEKVEGMMRLTDATMHQIELDISRVKALSERVEKGEITQDAMAEAVEGLINTLSMTLVEGAIGMEAGMRFDNRTQAAVTDAIGAVARNDQAMQQLIDRVSDHAQRDIAPQQIQRTMGAVRDVIQGAVDQMKVRFHPEIEQMVRELVPEIERMPSVAGAPGIATEVGIGAMLAREPGRIPVVTEPGVAVKFDVRTEIEAAKLEVARMTISEIREQAEETLLDIRSAMQSARQDSIVVLANTIDRDDAQSVRSFQKFAAICNAANKPVVVAGVKGDGVEGMINRMSGVGYIDVTDDINPAGTVYNEMEKYQGSITVVLKDTESYGGRFAVNDPLFNIIVTGENTKFTQVLTAYVASVASGRGINYVTFTDEAVRKLAAMKKEAEGQGNAASCVQIDRTDSEQTDESIDEALFADFEADIAF